MRKALEDLVFLGAVEDDVKVYGKTWKMKTLTSNEHLKATDATGNYDTLTRIYALKLEILGRALKQVDDTPLLDEIETIELVKALQPAVVNKLYEQYEKLQTKQNEALKNLEEIKN